jgi:pimeloyl-ACP methyl ester carboxylesterase
LAVPRWRAHFGAGWFESEHMSDIGHHTFVLVPGGWCGSWAWRDAIAALRGRGHDASSPTLTGLGERSHVGGDTADLSTHIEDVVSHLEMEDLCDVTLVGWSYGGMVVTGALEYALARVKSVIYLDAFVPEHGKAFIDYVSADTRKFMERFGGRNKAVPPLPLAHFRLTEPSVAGFIEPRFRDHPWRALFEPAAISPAAASVPKAYVRCRLHEMPALDDAFERMKQAGARTARIDADHFAPLTATEIVVDALTGLA